MGKQPTNRNMTRLNIALLSEVRKQIEDIRDYTHAESMTKVIRKAVSVYDNSLSLTEDSSQIIVRGKEGDKEIILV